MIIDKTTENILYLLWRESIPQSEWVEQLSQWAGCTKNRAKEILDGASLSDSEQAKLVSSNPDITIEELQYERLVERHNILHLNLEFLFSYLEHGELKDLAEDMGVGSVAIYRWKAGKQKPSKSHQIILCSKFGIHPNTDLSTEAIFLRPLIVGQQRKKWLKEQIDKLPPEELDKLFPSLERIFKET